jgi:hypothetical protein
MTPRETLDAIAWIIVRAVQLGTLFAALTYGMTGWMKW